MESTVYLTIIDLVSWKARKTRLPDFEPGLKEKFEDVKVCGDQVMISYKTGENLQENAIRCFDFSPFPVVANI